MAIGGAISSFAISTAAISAVLQQQAQEEEVVVVVPAGGGDERKLDIIEAQAEPNSRKKKPKKTKAAKPKKAKKAKPTKAGAPDLPLLEYNLPPKKRKKAPPKPKQRVLDAGEHIAALPPLPPAPPKPAAWIGDVQPEITPEGNLLFLPPAAPLEPAPVYGLTPALARMQADMRDVHDAMAVLRFLAEEDLAPA